MKKGFSIVEFLITFGLFVVIIFYIFLDTSNKVSLVSDFVNNFLLYLDGLKAYALFLSYNLSQLQYLENLYVSNYSNFQKIMYYYFLDNRSIFLKYRPSIIFLHYTRSSNCVDCIDIVTRNSSVTIYHNTTKFNSTLSLVLISDSTLSYNTVNVTTNCVAISQYPYAYYSIVRTPYFCIFHFHKRGYVEIKNIWKNSPIIIKDIMSPLPIYLNGSKVLSSIGSDFFSRNMKSYLFFKNMEKNNVIFEYFLKIG